VAELNAADKRAVRQLAHQVSQFVQRRVYEQAVAALVGQGGLSANRAADVLLCLEAAAAAVETVDETSIA
jgi:hypothetical protein